MRIRIAPRVASAAVPIISPVIFPRAPRVRAGSAAAADLLISGNIRILIYAVRAVAEVAAVAVRILHAGCSYTNDLQFQVELLE
jgi:hypothetical protein